MYLYMIYPLKHSQVIYIRDDHKWSNRMLRKELRVKGWIKSIGVKKLKKKIAIEIAFVILFFIIATFSGCVEEEGEQHIVRYTQPTIPMSITQNINGNYKVQDVSGDTININGNYNKIMILNVDVSLIRVNGNYNNVYYPKEAIATIKETGSGNVIKAY